MNMIRMTRIQPLHKTFARKNHKTAMMPLFPWQLIMTSQSKKSQSRTIQKDAREPPNLSVFI